MKKTTTVLFVLVLLTINYCFSIDFPWQPKDAREFINIETRFVFTDLNGENKKSMVYGSREFVEEEYFVPQFKVGIPVLLNIQMNPTLLEKAKGIFGVRESEKNSEREITVEVTITKSKNIQVTQSGGLSNVFPQPNIDGSTTYTFTIRNNSELFPSVSFKFIPAEDGEASITVKYYGSSPEEKIVESSCDVFQSVTFF